MLDKIGQHVKSGWGTLKLEIKYNILVEWSFFFFGGEEGCR